jgi:hypothetical protein
MTPFSCIELGERRVDFVEAYELFKALGVDPAKEAAHLMNQFREGQLGKSAYSSLEFSTGEAVLTGLTCSADLPNHLPVSK